MKFYNMVLFSNFALNMDKSHKKTTRSAYIAYTRNKEYRPLVYWRDDKPTVGYRS